MVSAVSSGTGATPLILLRSVISQFLPDLSSSLHPFQSSNIFHWPPLLVAGSPRTIYEIGESSKGDVLVGTGDGEN